MQLWETNIIKKPRNLWIPPVPAWSVKKQKKNEQQRHISSMYFCIPWGILANVKISHLSAFSSWLCDLFPSLQADNPYIINWYYSTIFCEFIAILGKKKLYSILIIKQESENRFFQSLVEKWFLTNIIKSVSPCFFFFLKQQHHWSN